MGRLFFMDTQVPLEYSNLENKAFMTNKKSLEEVLELFQPEDDLAIPLATGQPMTLMNALSNRTDWKKLKIFCGLLGFPYPILSNPNVYIISGYYGPIERFLNKEGANMEYLPANFRGFEVFAQKKPTRVIATCLSKPDKDGFCTFGTHGAAIYKPFIEACKDPDRLAIAEVNETMPVVYGSPDHGDNKIHINDIDVYFESNSSQSEVPDIPETEREKKISDFVMDLIDDGATLQFGIGAIPDLLAEKLAVSNLSNFGVHSELISDGYLKLFEAGKISNQNKAHFKGQTIFTFAFGKKPLYDFLDERQGKNKRQAICLPVTIVNDPYMIAQNKNFVSINSGLMIDFAGQVCSEAIGMRQYSGVGGQLSFVQGAYYSEKGKTIICVKSTAEVDGKLVSNILPTFPPREPHLHSSPLYSIYYH